MLRAMATHQSTAPASTITLPLADLQAQVRSFRRAAQDVAAPAAPDALPPALEFDLVFSTGAPVRRYDWANDRFYNEVLDVSPQAVNLARLQRGVPLLNTHQAYSLEDQIGVVDTPAVADGVATARAQTSRRESVRGIVQDVEDGVIRNVSVGYARDAVVMYPPQEGVRGEWEYRVTAWTPLEVSLVPIPADMDSQVVRSATGVLQTADGTEVRSFACAATIFDPAGGVAPVLEKRTLTMADSQTNGGPAATSAPAAPTAAPVQAQDQNHGHRAAEIVDLCTQFGQPDLAAELLRSGATVDAARAAILDKLAQRGAAPSGAGAINVTRVTTVQDQVDVRMAGVSEALLAKVDPRVKLTDNGRQWAGLRMLELGREYLNAAGVNTRGMSAYEVSGLMIQHRSGGMMTTGDFSSILANVSSKRLRAAYEQNPGTYRLWARRAPNAPDFKSITVAALSGAPDLQQVNEHGEFKTGYLKDAAATYNVVTSGRIVSLSRQAIINDDLRAFDRLVTAWGAAAARYENAVVYALLTGNPTMPDTGALFNATATTTAGGHANLISGGGSVIAVAGLNTGRAAMRLQKGLQGEVLNVAPAYLIVPAALEQTAYQFTSSNYVPAQASNVNEFRAGGRTALEPIVEPLLDANSATAWYLAANSATIDTVEYCYLDGAEGPVIESEPGFEVDGISQKCRLDFGAQVIDFRGLLKSAGA